MGQHPDKSQFVDLFEIAKKSIMIHKTGFILFPVERGNLPPQSVYFLNVTYSMDPLSILSGSGISTHSQASFTVMHLSTA